MTCFTLVSLNIWDLPIALPGTRRGLRRRRMLDGLPKLNADLVLLQEAFRPRLRHELADAMTGFHADAYLRKRRRVALLPFDTAGGLLTFSRWPIVETHYQSSFALPRMKWDERLGRKGILWTVVETPAGRLTVGNVHLYAGSAPIEARVRASQARRITRAARRLPDPMVIAGDFNIALETERPSRGPTAFAVMEEAGFREVADGATGEIATMDPRRNRWARYMPSHRPARRLTHVFFRNGALRPAAPPRLVLDDPPVSDHFGLEVTFEWSIG